MESRELSKKNRAGKKDQYQASPAKRKISFVRISKCETAEEWSKFVDDWIAGKVPVEEKPV